MIGPKGLGRTVTALRSIAPELPFDINFIELSENNETIEFDGFRIEAFKVQHNMVCYGYSMVIDRAGRFDVERAKAQEIPLKLWSILQRGETVTVDDRTFTPDMVLGEDRRGIKVTYCTDSRPTPSIVDGARDADLFICEGMYGEPDMEEKAKEHKHMTFYEAAELARKAEVKELWLTHYSPSLVNPKGYQKNVREVFAATHVCKDGRTIELKFEEENGEEETE